MKSKIDAKNHLRSMLYKLSVKSAGDTFSIFFESFNKMIKDLIAMNSASLKDLQ